VEREKAKKALAFCERNPLLYVDISECVRRGAAEILYAECGETVGGKDGKGGGKDGVLLFEKSSGIYALAAEREDGVLAALDFLDEKALAAASKWLVAHGDICREIAYKKLHIVRENACFQVAYMQKKTLPLRGDLEFSYPNREQIEQIKRDYKLESPENIEKLCKEQKLWAAILKSTGEFVGFIGEHPEGSMGLLQIFPKFRRNGYAEEAEKFQINRYVTQGRIPYGHVIDGNVISVALQEKLGLETANEKVYWLREDENF
jgi:hypothetical protein